MPRQLPPSLIHSLVYSLAGVYVYVCMVCTCQVHFGVRGYGSGEEIGDIMWVQRATYAMRILSIFLVVPFYALLFGGLSAAWALGLRP